MAKIQITPYKTLKDLISDRKDYLVEEMIKKLKILPQTDVGEVLVDSQTGVYRLKTFIDLVITALEGHSDLLFHDSKLSGYSSAIKPISMSYACQFYLVFLTRVYEVLKTLSSFEKIRLYEDFLDLTDIVFKCFTIVATCSIEAKEDRVIAKVKQYRELYGFTHKILNPVKMEDPITQRESDVLKGMVEGKSSRLIAETLFISEDTVRSHIKKIYRKLNVSSRGQAVTKAIRLKIIEGL
jgi:DNA-binding CsgD family transcriptional regulator